MKVFPIESKTALIKNIYSGKEFNNTIVEEILNLNKVNVHSTALQPQDIMNQKQSWNDFILLL